MTPRDSVTGHGADGEIARRIDEHHLVRFIIPRWVKKRESLMGRRRECIFIAETNEYPTLTTWFQFQKS
jgi:hypothetical protein